MRMTVMIAAVLFMAASVFAADRNLQNRATVYTDQDLEKYRLPSDSRGPDTDAGYHEDSPEPGKTTAIDGDPEHLTVSPHSATGKKRAYSEIKVLLYKTNT